MWFGVLGPVAVRDGLGNPLRINGPARRQLLAALLCRHGRVVAAESLVEDIWGDAPPRSAAKTLQSHIVRLRNDLGRASGSSPLVTVAAGYQLALDEHDLDAARFERLVRGGSEVADSDPQMALAMLEEALALWRDEAYVEFGEASFAVVERLRLAELRALAEDRRTDLLLEAGRSAELIADLGQRVAAAPFRERGWEQLALACYRTGRQAEALAIFRQVRNMLAAELGVDPGPGLRDLEYRVLQQDPTLRHELPPRSHPMLLAQPDVCPYRGLAGYAETDGRLFVGRERLTAELAGLVAGQPLVVVVGPSGSGKSSLLRAGLIPALRAGALPGSSAWRVEQVSARRLASTDQPTGGLVIVDQAEELFTLLDAAARKAAAGCLLELLSRGQRVILVLRSDFFGRLSDLGRAGERAARTVILVRPLRDDEVRRVVLEPAGRAGLVVEPALLEAVLDDISGQSAALPLLSVALVRSWQNRSADQLTLDGYRAGGGIAGALEAAAEDVFQGLPDSDRATARQLLVRMAAREGDSWARRPLPVGDLTRDEQHVLHSLAGGRLVTVSEARVEPIHDALLTEWPRLRAWLDERGLFAELLAHLGSTSRAWEVTRSDADLYRGARLQAALDWASAHPEDLTASERAFLSASEAAATAELDAARRRTLEEARGRRRLRFLATALVGVLCFALLGGGVAVTEWQSAKAAAARARQAALAADSRRLAALAATASDIGTSSLLAVAAYRLQDSPDSRGALLTAVERNQSALWRIAEPSRLLRIALSPDGARIYAMDNRRVIRVIDVGSDTQLASYPARASFLDGATSDGGVIVAGSAPGNDQGTGRVSVLDAETGASRRVLTTGADVDSFEPKLSADRRWLVTVMSGPARRPDRQLEVFDLALPGAPPRAVNLAVQAAGLALGDHTALVSGTDGTVTEVDLPSLRAVGLGRVPGLAAAPGSEPLEVSPDGRWLATVGAADPDLPALYDTRQLGHPPVLLSLQRQPVTVLAFAPDGTQLAVATVGGDVSAYRVDGTTTGTYAGVGAAVTALVWAGTTAGPTALYSAGLDSEVVSWDLGTTLRLVRTTGSALPMPDTADVFGSTVVGVTPKQTVPGTALSIYTVDLSTGRRKQWPLQLQASDEVNQTVASADGSRALVSIQADNGSGNGRAEIWDLHTGRDVGTLKLPSFDQALTGMNAAISGDGQFGYAPLDGTHIGVFQLPSGRYLRSFAVTFGQPDADRIFAVPWRVDPRGRLLVLGGDDGPPAPPPPPAPLGQAQGSDPPDQRALLVDPSTGRVLAETRLGDITSPTAVGWSGDGSRLALGTVQGQLMVFDAGTLHRTADVSGAVAGDVNSVGFSPDGASLAVGGTDGTLSIWSVPGLQREGVPLGRGDGGSGWWYGWYAPGGQVVGFRPNIDGSRGSWFTFSADPASLARAACQLAGRELSREEWSRYAPDRPYENVCGS